LFHFTITVQSIKRKKRIWYVVNDSEESKQGAVANEMIESEDAGLASK